MKKGSVKKGQASKQTNEADRSNVNEKGNKTNPESIYTGIRKAPEPPYEPVHWRQNPEHAHVDGSGNGNGHKISSIARSETITETASDRNYSRKDFEIGKQEPYRRSASRHRNFSSYGEHPKSIGWEEYQGANKRQTGLGYSDYVAPEYESSHRERDFDQRSYRGRFNRMRSMHFESYASEGNRFINEVAEELGADRNCAARVTKAVLHAVRDRIPMDDAIEFAQGLPMALKGVFIDQYDPSRTPVPIRNAPDFIDFVCSKDHFAADVDFPDPKSVVNALQAVFTVLERNMDYGQVEQIKRLLHSEIRSLIDNY